MNIISINHILELNQKLVEEGLFYKVHLRDACGRQSMWLEAITDKENELSEEEKGKENKMNERVYEIIEDYFNNQRMLVEYSQDKSTIWLGK